MNNTDMIKELRQLTQAGMKDCKDALEEANWELQKAIDLIKKKGQNIVSGREGKVAAEGRVCLGKVFNYNSVVYSLIEINCQTDFVANSDEFKVFAEETAAALAVKTFKNEIFSIEDFESARQEVVVTTKENVVVRRWWAEQVFDPKAKVFSYIHSNNKIGVLLTLLAPTEEVANSEQFTNLGNDLVMQVAAMNPSAVSVDRLSLDLVNRQKAIFEAQLKELNKPEASWAKILEGKMGKWHKEVCLLEQESVVESKKSVKDVIKNVSTLLGGDISVVNFTRAQVGEGVEAVKSNLAEEVSKMSGVPMVEVPVSKCFP